MSLNFNKRGRSHVPKELQDRASASLNLKDDVTVFISFEHLIRYVEEGKS
jgi:hypothetical protein